MMSFSALWAVERQAPILTCVELALETSKTEKRGARCLRGVPLDVTGLQIVTGFDWPGPIEAGGPWQLRRLPSYHPSRRQLMSEVFFGLELFDTHPLPPSAWSQPVATV